MDAFLAPVVDLLNTKQPACEIHWVYPGDEEQNRSFSIPPLEVRHYLESMIREGFYASVRLHSNPEEDRLLITLWEEIDGDFGAARWPVSFRKADFESVWSGYRPERKWR